MRLSVDVTLEALATELHVDSWQAELLFLGQYVIRFLNVENALCGIEKKDGSFEALWI